MTEMKAYLEQKRLIKKLRKKAAKILELCDTLESALKKPEVVCQPRMKEESLATRVLRYHFGDYLDKFFQPDASKKNKVRPISTLKPNEAIQVNNKEELDGILKLMEAEGWKWLSVIEATKWFPDHVFPYVLSCFRDADECIFSDLINSSYTIFPASDFLPQK